MLKGERMYDISRGLTRLRINYSSLL